MNFLVLRSTVPLGRMLILIRQNFLDTVLGPGMVENLCCTLYGRTNSPSARRSAAIKKE